MILAALICLVDVCESTSIARALARKNKYKLNYTQELRSLGFCNIAGALSSCYNVTGSMSRSAVYQVAGARTSLASFVTSMSVMVVLLCLTPVFTHMSSNVQAAIIIVGALSLMEWGEMVHLWGVNKLDFAVWWFTFLFTIFFTVEIGIGVGVAVSLLVVFYRTAFPTVSTLGCVPKAQTFRSRKLYPDVIASPGIVVMQPESRIVFACLDGVEESIMNQIQDNIEAGDRPRYLVLDMGPVSDIDAAGIGWLKDFVPELKRDYGITTVIGNLNRTLLINLKRGDMVSVIGRENIHMNLRSAIAWAQRGMQEAQEEEVEIPGESPQDESEKSD